MFADLELDALAIVGRGDPAAAWRIGPGAVVASRAERLAQDDEPRPVVHQHLQADLGDERGHPGQHLVGRHGRASRRLDLRVARARPGRLEHGVADERDRLRRVQQEARDPGGAGPARPP